MNYPRVASLKTAEQFRARLDELRIDLPLDHPLPAGNDLSLARPYQLGERVIGNRFAILPMEGWDGTQDGRPTDFTFRRWENFGKSGAKLIWGGEAVAVRHDGRANPNQLAINSHSVEDLGRLRATLVAAHQGACDGDNDLLTGLQLTHSGRYANPNRHGHREPRIVYRHPLLDERMQGADRSVFSDDELDQLIEDFVTAAGIADEAGFDFVDIKHCHGYLGHELLSAVDRPGKYGGSLENRTRFLKSVIEGIRRSTPAMQIGVRLNVFDFAPFVVEADGVAKPQVSWDYRYAFGGDGSGTGINLDEPVRVLKMLQSLGVRLVCTTAGCPYYCPHIQRPAIFPPSDGYLPPEDPLVGVARQISVTANLKKRFPDMLFVGSGYSYLQEWLPAVASAVVRQGQTDFAGLGRMVLAYPHLPADVLAGKPLDRKRICRTFSDCTTAPRQGMKSGCYPLDPFYKALPERERLVELKRNRQ